MTLVISANWYLTGAYSTQVHSRSQAVSRSVLLTAYVTFEPPGEAGEGLV